MQRLSTIPISAGTWTAWLLLRIVRCEWTWYVNCSLVSQGIPSTGAPLAGLRAAAGVVPAVLVPAALPVEAVAAIRAAAADEVGVGATAFFVEQAVSATSKTPIEAVSRPLPGFMRSYLSALWL